MDKYEAGLSIDIAIQSFLDQEFAEDQKNARLEVRRILQEFSGVDVDKNKTLTQAIGDIYKVGDRKTFRDLSIFIIRLLSIQNFIPRGKAEENIDANVLAIIETGFDDIYKRFSIEKKEQTYIKIDKLIQVMSYCEDKLTCLSNFKPKIETISAERQSILSSLADSALKSFLSPYNFSRIRASIEAILSQVIKFSSTTDITFTRKLKELADVIEEEVEYCKNSPTFLARDHYQKFLKLVDAAVTEIATRSKEQFLCDIYSTKGAEFTLDKKYPLHKVGHYIKLLIPLNNSGPGIADRVSVEFEVDNNNILLNSDKIDIGGVRPGDFVIPLTITAYEEIKSFSLIGTISWKIIGDSEYKSYNFITTVKSQKKGVDWHYLESLHPYSLDVATGENFYGRKDLLIRLLARIKPGKMQSSYITGQRRVGKSSLAKAVENRVIAESDGCRVLYIECGEFKSPNAYSTVDVLRDNIQAFLISYMPSGFTNSMTPQTGSLSSLSNLLGHLENYRPEIRFLIIIDEFDEINPELYRYSDIAETFFLNLRSLSGKKNVSFIFVGAEKMSYVMSSQGEKLNKFSNESLDIFSQENEWEDYENLVRGSISDRIEWHEPSIREVFNVTNGHPYFTKQVCARAFENAVTDKDSEITTEEVENAVKNLVTELDINAFQHFWRDGIIADAADIEVINFKRCHILAGLARTMRLTQKCNVENIKNNIHSAKILDHEVVPFLTEFCRRNIINEHDGIYFITIPIFERWLVNAGFNRLIADQLGDDLYEERQAIEDLAYVTDDDIVNLTAEWPDYRGVRISNRQVREWLSQVSSHTQQRILFKILKNIRLFGEAEIRKNLKTLHEKLKSKLPIMVTKSKAQRRKDIWVTYVDGPGKSGSHYAGCYAEENLISATCVKEMTEIDAYINGKKKFPEDLSAIIIVDDFIGSGSSLSGNLESFYQRNKESLKAARISIYIVVICATKNGEDRVRNTISSLDDTADLIVCENVDKSNYAFGDTLGFWETESEKSSAKDLCQRLGTNIDRARPLGYQDSAMLLVFSRNCPNNTIPILHSNGRGHEPWFPLFERIKH